MSILGSSPSLALDCLWKVFKIIVLLESLIIHVLMYYSIILQVLRTTLRRIVHVISGESVTYVVQNCERDLPEAEGGY